MNRNVKKPLLRKLPGFCAANFKNGYHITENSDGKPRYIYHRIVGYSVGAVVHLLNILAMNLSLRGAVMKDPDVEFFYSMEFFYFTIWNLVFQLVYIGIGLACDVPILLEKNYKILNCLRCFRTTYYNGIVWPCGMIICLVYWPVYAYDRNLIFPDYIDKALSQVSNYIMHLFIFLPIVWEMLFLPNQKPSTQKYCAGLCVGVYIAYNIAIFSQYGLRGVWPYPGLKLIYGTFYFPLVLLIISIILLAVYLVQWPLISCIWSKRLATGK